LTTAAHLTPEEYLDIECQLETRNEYFQGRMFEMPPSPWSHSLLVGNALCAISQQFQGAHRYVVHLSQRLRVDATGLYAYPDVIALDEEPHFVDDADTLNNPCLLVEVLSRASEAYDRGEKYEHYRTIPTLRHFLMVACDRVAAELYTRQPNGSWELAAAENKLAGSIDITTMGIRLDLARLYHRVSLENP
jgi:Uma2 family endonuclease